MSFSINYTGIIKHKTVINSKFGGSSRFRVVEGELIEISKPQRIISGDKVKDLCLFENKKVYKLNKSKIKKKCHAFSRLEKSRKFFAFYSISFPSGLNDETCYMIFNTWLTRCRKNSGLKSYLWVAERQKNGTIHFHLLTNDFMEIKTVNGFMRSALLTKKKKGIEALESFNPEKYNGVDVKRVGNDKKKLIGYLAKYICKNQIEFYRLPWHCSRDVSRLFTSMNIDEPEEEKYFQLLPMEVERYTEIIYKKYFNATGFKFKPDDLVFEDLDGLNELIYNT